MTETKDKIYGPEDDIRAQFDPIFHDTRIFGTKENPFFVWGDFEWLLAPESYEKGKCTKTRRAAKLGGRGGFLTVLTPKGVREMRVMNLREIKELLSQSRSPYVHKVAKALGFDTLIGGYDETLYFAKLTIAFPDIIMQYKVDRYKIDGYIKKYNVAIECDESQHAYYNKDEDAKRTETINKILDNPSWVRFKPGQDIFEIIGKIIAAILK